MLVSSFGPDSAVAASPPLTSATLQASWQAVHNRLASSLDAANPAGAAVYAYGLHQAFGTTVTRQCAQQLAQRLAAQPWPKPGCAWTTAQLDQARALAWLTTHFLAAGLPPICPAEQLVNLDSQLIQQAQITLARLQPSSRGTLIRVVRYLTLRLPTPAVVSYLGALVAQWPELPTQGPVQFGLDGLAGELLTLLRLRKAGMSHPTVLARIQQGIQCLLASRRAVDFQQQHYSVFPDALAPSLPGGRFSADLSWQRGDLVQAWLLYEAHGVLHDAELAHIAELVGLNTLLRTSEPATTITSADFYSGAAGVAQRYAQLYQASGHAAYRAAYQYWLGRTQELVPALLSTSSGCSSPTGRECLGGLVGVGLLLLTAGKGLPSTWKILEA